MNFSEVVELIENRHDLTKMSHLKPYLLRRLKFLKSDQYRDRGLIYYYLLRLGLWAPTLYETEELRSYYQKMDECFLQEEKRLFGESRKKRHQQLKEFYRLMERCYATIQMLYHNKDAVESGKHSYERKMIFRKRYYFFNKEYWKYFEYSFLEITSSYGDSFLRWGLTSFSFGLAMAVIYAILDYRLIASYRIIPSDGHWFDYIYFSLVTLTSLGIGDFVPKTFLAKFFVSMEVFFGFIMLGIFVSLIQKKL